MANKPKNTFLALVCLLPLLGSCSKGNSVDLASLVPQFQKSEGVSFIAYAGPTVENWAGNNKNVNTLTEEHYQKLEDAGFNGVLALYEGAGGGTGNTPLETTKKVASRAQEHAKIALPLANKHHLKYYVRDWSFYGMYNEYNNPDDYENLIRNGIFNDQIDYYKEAGYGGNFCADEPSAEQIDLIAKQVEIYNGLMKEKGVKGECFVNLDPIYVGPSSLSKTGSMDYETYARHYFEKLGKELGYVSYDYYPLYKDDNNNSYVRSSYLENLELMARLCKENNAELRTFVQTVGNWTGMRRIDYISDIRFQVYCNLAFGSKEMSYYQYAGHKETGIHSSTDSLLDYVNGTYNYTYDFAKTVNREVHAFEDAYLSYSYDQVTTHLGNEMMSNLCFENIQDQSVESFPEAKILSSDQDTLMTSFKNEKEEKAFMLVNFTDPYSQLDDTVTIRFEDADGLLMYRLGQKMLVKLPKNKEYTFKLYPGEGRFIIPLKESR